MSYLLLIKLHTTEILAKIFTVFNIKAFIVFLIVVLEFMIGATNIPTMGMLLTLISLDFLTAIIAQFKMGHAIESRKAIKTVLKILVYSIFVSGAYLTEEIIPGATFLDDAAISYLAITELISIMENLGKMGYTMPKKMLNNLRNMTNNK